jgi:hypothetical protein
VSYLARDNTEADAARAAFGPNFERLIEVKRTYDPGNLSRPEPGHRPLIIPAAQEPIAQMTKQSARAEGGNDGASRI